MNELFAQLFGQQPSYATALLGEDEATRLQRQAQQQGLLNVGLSLLAGSGPSPQRRGIGQLLAQGVAAGQQAYQGAYDKAVRDRMLQEQIMERQQARAEQQMAQQAIQQAFVPREVFATDPISGERVVTGMTPPSLDMTRLQGILGSLTPGARSQVLKEAASIQSAFAPKRLTLKEGEQVVEETPEGGFRPLIGLPKTEKPTSDIQEYERAVKQGFKGSLLDYQLALKRAGATQVVIPEKTFGAEFGKGVAEAVQQGYQSAVAASSTLDSIAAIRPILQSGEVFSGPLANQQMLLARIGTTLGVAGQDTQEKAKNTAIAMQQLANLELKQAEAMKGQGAITDFERTLISRAAAGDLGKMSAGEVQALLGALEKTAKSKIQIHERNLTNLSKNPELKNLLPMYQLPTRSGW